MTKDELKQIKDRAEMPTSDSLVNEQVRLDALALVSYAEWLQCHCADWVRVGRGLAQTAQGQHTRIEKIKTIVSMCRDGIRLGEPKETTMHNLTVALDEE